METKSRDEWYVTAYNELLAIKIEQFELINKRKPDLFEEEMIERELTDVDVYAVLSYIKD